MRRLLVFLAYFLCTCSRESDRKPSRPGEIFRYTVVGRATPFDSIVLGQRWKTAAKYGATDRDTLFALPYGYFAGADAIGIRRDSLGVVTSLEFVYHATRDANALLADYRRSLGAPAAVTTDTLAGATRTTTRWQDEATEFVITTMMPPDRDSVVALAFLSDRRLSAR